MLADIIFRDAPSDLRHAQANALRRAVSPYIAAKYVELMTSLDVRSFPQQVQAPTLIVQPRSGDDRRVNAGRAVAAVIPDARFFVLESVAPDDFGETARLMAQFLDEGRAQSVPSESGGDVRTLLFTDMEGSTALTQRLGDAKAQELVRAHNDIVRGALKAHAGTEIKYTGDGIMASFPSASGALECAVAIQQGVEERSAVSDQLSALRVRIGVNAGEPVAEEQDLFGTAVQLASRICARAGGGEILASDVVRQLAAGKDFLFSDIGETELRGFEDPVRLYEVRWRD